MPANIYADPKPIKTAGFPAVISLLNPTDTPRRLPPANLKASSAHQAYGAIAPYHLATPVHWSRIHNDPKCDQSTECAAFYSSSEHQSAPSHSAKSKQRMHLSAASRRNKMALQMDNTPSRNTSDIESSLRTAQTHPAPQDLDSQGNLSNGHPSSHRQT